MNIKKSFLFLCVFIFSAHLSHAQQQSTTTEKVDEKTADVAITAKVEAKELKFEIVPNPKVEFPGTPERKTEWSSERKNLPDSVEPNVIYRDIGITLKIVSVFADIEKIVDDALGTTPQTKTEPAEPTAQTPENKPKETAPATENKTTGNIKTEEKLKYYADQKTHFYRIFYNARFRGKRFRSAKTGRSNDCR